MIEEIRWKKEGAPSLRCAYLDRERWGTGQRWGEESGFLRVASIGWDVEAALSALVEGRLRVRGEIKEGATEARKATGEVDLHEAEEVVGEVGLAGVDRGERSVALDAQEQHGRRKGPRRRTRRLVQRTSVRSSGMR